jgi:GNAT superfamily N-acetyltransferase
MASRTSPSKVPALRMSIEPHAGDELRRVVSDRLDLFNVATTGLDRWHAVSIFLRDPDDEIAGGLLGEIWGGWLEVKYLWVAEPFRGRGHASALLSAAERFALARGCSASHLDSYTFQAPDFYVKHGYHVFGVLDDYPPGHQRVFLRKTLDAKASARGRAPKKRARGRRRAGS